MSSQGQSAEEVRIASHPPGPGHQRRMPVGPGIFTILMEDCLAEGGNRRAEG